MLVLYNTVHMVIWWYPVGIREMKISNFLRWVNYDLSYSAILKGLVEKMSRLNKSATLNSIVKD